MFEQTLFLIQFLVIIGIILFSFYNVVNEGKFFDLKINFVLLILFIIMFFVCNIIVFSNPEVIIYVSILKLETGLLILQSLFFLSSIFFFAKDTNLFLKSDNRYIPQDNYRGIVKR